MSEIHSRYNEIEQLIYAEKYDEAIAGLKALLEEDESFVLAHLALARAFSKTDQHELAVGHAERACELEPNDPVNFTALSMTCQKAIAATQDIQFKVRAEDAMERARMLQSGM